MGSYAELDRPEKMAARMIYVDLDCAAVAREINAKFGVSGRPQIVSRQFLSRLKLGKVKGNRCSPFLAECIASVLDLSVADLFTVHEVSHSVAQTGSRKVRAA